METDASDCVSVGVLSLRGEDRVLYPITFYSKNHSPAETNYEIYDKELMGIVRALEEWRTDLKSAKSLI